MPRLLFTPGKDPVPIVQEAGWAPGSVWTGAEKLASTGIRSPDHPGLSQSLYRLSCPGLHTALSKEKVKRTLVRALRLCTGCTAHRGSRGIALLFHDQRQQKGVSGQRHAPAALYSQERPSTHCRRLGGPQGRSGHVQKILPPLGFNPWTVQHVASRYTD